MPRTLARGQYSASAVLDVVLSDACLITQRFDLVDRDFRWVADLDVVSAQVDWDGSRAIQRSLRMSMLPRTDLLNVPFRYLVKPYFAFGMPDGGWAEFPMGAYPFTVPTRVIEENAAVGSGTSDTAGDDSTPENPEVWNVTLGDQTHYLDAGGPGPVGFTVPAGSLVTDAIVGLLGRCNIRDTTGVTPSAAITPETLTWTLRSGAEKQRWFWNYYTNRLEGSTESQADQATTWLGIARSLHAQLGYEPPWFDLDLDRYVARPAADYSQLSSAPIIKYVAGNDSILLPGITSTPDLAAVKNRWIVTARNAQGVNDVAVADLNDLIPGHPLSQGVTGFYIDGASTSSVAANQLQLYAMATEALYASIRTFESVPFSTLVNPAHDGWELLALQVPGDAIYTLPQLMAEMSFSVDLFTGQMAHGSRRLGLNAIPGGQ